MAKNFAYADGQFKKCRFGGRAGAEVEELSQCGRLSMSSMTHSSSFYFFKILTFNLFLCVLVSVLVESFLAKHPERVSK